MNTKYFLYALFVTAVATMFSWGSMIGSSSGKSRGSSWSTPGGTGGSFGGGGHK